MKLLVKSEFFEVEVEGQTAQEVWQRAAFWHSLPTVCPVDGSPVRFGYSNRGGYDFYFLESTGTPRYEFQFGQSLEGKELFPGKVRGQGKDKKTCQEWAYWDAANECQVVAWRDGKMLTKPEAGEVEHRTIASDAELDRMLDQVLPVQHEEPDPWDMAYQVFDSLGKSLYGTQWWTIACRNAERISNNQAANPRNLSLEQIQRLTEGLRKVQAKGVQVGVTA